MHNLSSLCLEGKIRTTAARCTLSALGTPLLGWPWLAISAKHETVNSKSCKERGSMKATSSSASLARLYQRTSQCEVAKPASSNPMTPIWWKTCQKMFQKTRLAWHQQMQSKMVERVVSAGSAVWVVLLQKLAPGHTSMNLKTCCPNFFSGTSSRAPCYKIAFGSAQKKRPSWHFACEEMLSWPVFLEILARCCLVH